MKIVIDARLYGLENAGLGRYVINLIEGLKEADKNNQYAVLLRRKYFNELNFSGNWKKVLADFPHYSFAEQFKLPGLIAEDNPDLIHFPHFNFPIFYQGKFIVTIHDLLMQRYRGAKATTLPFYFYYPKQLIAKYVFKKAVSLAQKVIVPSNAVRDEVKKYYRPKDEKIVVTYEGYDERFKNKGDASGIIKKYFLKSPYFIYAGNAYPHKNLTRAIEALVALNKTSGRDVKLVIVCPRNVFSKKLEELVMELNAGEWVKLLGFVPDEELAELYSNSLGFLFPSLSEGFGLPGLEAMAAGTLVLASDTAVFKEVYKDRAIYFNPYNYASIEKSMEMVLSMDPAKRKKLTKENQEFVKRYSWRKMAEETLKIYEDCARL